MIFRIPFQPSQNNYRIVVPLSHKLYLFDAKWNSEDGAWYFDLREEDETAILLGIKVVLGPLGRTCAHPFFTEWMMEAIDTSGQRLDAGFDDLNRRVHVVVTSVDTVLDG